LIIFAGLATHMPLNKIQRSVR